MAAIKWSLKKRKILLFCGLFSAVNKNKIPPLAGFVVRSWYWLRRHYQNRSRCLSLKNFYQLPSALHFREGFIYAEFIHSLSKIARLSIRLTCINPVLCTMLPVNFYFNKYPITVITTGNILLDSETYKVAATNFQKSETNYKNQSPVLPVQVNKFARDTHPGNNSHFHNWEFQRWKAMLMRPLIRSAGHFSPRKTGGLKPINEE